MDLKRFFQVEKVEDRTDVKLFKTIAKKLEELDKRIAKLEDQTTAKRK